MTPLPSRTTPEQRAKIFHEKLLRGVLKSAVNTSLHKEVGTVMTDDIDEKTGDSVAGS
jgi:hypothetical protein